MILTILLAVGLGGTILLLLNAFKGYIEDPVRMLV